MDIFQAIIIAIVEGLTEFLPVSSTGHMIIAEKVLGVVPNDFVKAFTIIIQFGAILSVVCLYYKRFFVMNPVKIMDKSALGTTTGMQRITIVMKRFLQKYDFYWKLLVGFIPAAVFGLAFSDIIDELLESVNVVAIMLILGGVLMLFVDKWFANKDKEVKITDPKAFKIGLYQCIAMIPGVSRSMATIVGGMQQGLSRKAAAEFSFFLAVPTMFAATAYKMLKLLMNEESRGLLMSNLDVLLIGNIVAFVVAILAIKFFINYVTKYGFKAFGYYRIIVGAVILVLAFCGVSLQIS
ncbi:MAG: undecaprenyl-diphosphate phosphatase [Muribaculaceae bacterium]|nr:undecaprenyl-diphosphate phosphatase [Muribaculaceae bacterium]